MARTLLLIRHAKAVQGGRPDESRPLADRGLRDAAVAGRWLVERDLVPTHVLVSPALRAQQTWESIAATLPTTPAVTTDGRIYDNTVESLLDVIHDAPDADGVVAVVGHNPSMHGLAYDLDDENGDDDARTAIASSYPTNGIAVYEFPGDWSSVALGGGVLREFVALRA